MVRITIAALGLLAASEAMAQQTLDEALTQVSVFNCTLGETGGIFLFRQGAAGMSLVGQEDAAVRVTETGLSVMTADGLREISDGAYHVYKDGAAESGTCTDITDFANTLYPAMTTAYAPDAEGLTVAEQAAAAALQDLTVKAQRATEDAQAAEALAAEARAELDSTTTALTAKLDSTTAELTATQAERAALATRAEEQAEELAAKQAALEALSADNAGLEAELAATKAERDSLAETVAALEPENAALKIELDALSATASEMQEAVLTLEAELAELKTLHASVSAAATEFQGQLGDTTGKLEASTAKNRSLVATISGLNSKISALGGTLRDVRAERDEALRKAEAASQTRTVSTSQLTTAAIRQLASMQGRSQNAVRSELCRLIGRGGGC